MQKSNFFQKTRCNNFERLKPVINRWIPNQNEAQSIVYLECMANSRHSLFTKFQTSKSIPYVKSYLVKTRHVCTYYNVFPGCVSNSKSANIIQLEGFLMYSFQICHLYFNKMKPEALYWNWNVCQTWHAIYKLSFPIRSDQGIGITPEVLKQYL